MDPTYVNVMETSELAYIMLVYGLHAAIALVHACLACFVIANGARRLLRSDSSTSRRWSVASVILGLMLLAPLAVGAPVAVSIVAAVLSGAMLLFIDRREGAARGRLTAWARRLAVAGAAIAALFMLWEREDNLALGADLLLGTLEFRNEELAWQYAHDPQSPKVGDMAPDFELQDPTGNVQVRLSDFRGKRPVALVFGSYT